jgi:transcriptional regulator of acetoin/glycerol metabolism
LVGSSALHRQRAAFFEQGPGRAGIRTELLESWRRSKAMGVSPATAAPPELPASRLDRRVERLLSGPLASYADSLTDTGLSLLLADHSGAILSRWCAEPQIARALDKVNSVPGAVLSEASVGTNGVGTPLAAQRPVEISRAEHVSDLYLSMACAGAPVRDPFTMEVLGVVAIAGTVSDDSPSLLPTLKRMLDRLSRQVTIDRPLSAVGMPAEPDASTVRLPSGLEARADRVRETGGLCLVSGEPGSGKATWPPAPPARPGFWMARWNS